MSIQAVKAVEIGEGWDNAARRGSEAHDAITFDPAARVCAADRSGGRHRGRHLQRGPAGGPGGHEAPGHPQPPRPRDGRRGDQGVDRQLPGAHRRHGGARHGRRGGDHDRAGAGLRGICASSVATRWPRWCATATGSSPLWAPPRRRRSVPSATSHDRANPPGRHDGCGQDHDGGVGGREARLGVSRFRCRSGAGDRV